VSLATGDLTTLAAVRSYMTGPPSDAVISGLVTRISRSILSILNRPLLVPRTYTQKFNGTGTRSLVLPYWPVLSLDSLAVNGLFLTEAPQPSAAGAISFAHGWRVPVWDSLPPGYAANVELLGSWFYHGQQNVVATYRAGYLVSAESASVPSDPGPYIVVPLAPYGIWATDEGVTYSDGTSFEAVSSSPSAGQYIPPDPNLSSPRNYYTFSLFDAEQTVLLSYGFIPADVEQIAIELISERSDYRRRLGVRSQSLASQESITYDNSGITTYVERMLDQYVSRIPTVTGANT
jgi:hypothetical protein